MKKLNFPHCLKSFKNLLVLGFAFGILACKNSIQVKTNHNTISGVNNSAIKFYKLGKLFVVGDFDGDRKTDTLYEHNFSRRTETEIDSIPEFNDSDMYGLNRWFQEQDADSYLVLTKKNGDTLHLGVSGGLYCLINIGDNNRDGKDEIAFSPERLDMSRTNSCSIYSLCGNKWTELKTFGIFEGAFDYMGDKQPIFTEIEGFLVKQNGQWMYKDYLDDPDGLGMKKLNVKKCR